MEVSRIRALRGPNLWSRHTSIEAIVTCSEAERFSPASSALLESFLDRLLERFPEIGLVMPAGAAALPSVAHALQFAALGLQASAGCPVTFSRTSETLDPGVYQVVVEYTEEPVGRLAFDLAVSLCQAALENTPFDLDNVLARLRELDEDVRLGPSTGSIVDAAIARNIPFRRLTEGSLVQFGWGSKQRRIQAAEMDCTSAIAESIAQDKELTKELLRAAGVPVPWGRTVADADDAWAAAQEIGLPVVVKPRDGNQGKGVAVNLKSEAEVRQAFDVASEFRDDVMVEPTCPARTSASWWWASSWWRPPAAIRPRSSATACIPSASWWTR